MPNWPETLPASPLADRFRETLAETRVRTNMDQGQPKVRSRTTAGVSMLYVSYLLTQAQTETLDGFYKDDLEQGTASFTLTHPRSGDAINCRFRRPPEYVAQGACFRADLELEVLP